MSPQSDHPNGVVHYDDATLRTFAADVIRALGGYPEHAEIVARHLVLANLVGHDSHGVFRLPQYTDFVDRGHVDPKARPTVEREAAATALIDGHNAWGHAVAEFATQIAAAKAGRTGMAAIGVRNAFHIGRAGAYALMLAEQGLIAQIFCGAEGSAFIAPWGGTERRLSTNPIAIAIPTGGDPILVDMTTSVVAEGKVKLARTAGKTLPPGWVLDKDGEPSTDPEDLYAGGTLLPLGGNVGHKGYGLGVIVDLLGSVLTGGLPGMMGPILHNHFLLQVFDPATITDRGAMEAAQERYFEYLRSSRKRAGVAEILLPGEPEQRSAADRQANGIPLDAGVIRSLDELCERLSVTPLAERQLA